MSEWPVFREKLTSQFRIPGPAPVIDSFSHPVDVCNSTLLVDTRVDEWDVFISCPTSDRGG